MARPWQKCMAPFAVDHATVRVSRRIATRRESAAFASAMMTVLRSGSHTAEKAFSERPRSGIASVGSSAPSGAKE